jgi:glycosyltransferase involved in cell wall biosynthesis
LDIPQITIITVCYNSVATIRDTLESVASQSNKNLEHITVDGGSTDKTVAVIREWRKHPFLKLNRIKGYMMQ